MTGPTEYRFSEEQDAFRRSIRDVVERDIKPNVAGWEADGCVPRSLFKKLGELGFLGVRLSEEYGGGGLDFWATTILVEELVACGAVGVAVSIMGHAEFSTKMIDRFGTPEQKEEFLRPAILGERIGALGVTEPNAGSDVGAIATRAVRNGDDLIINGAKTYITNGTIADFVTTAVRTHGPGHKGISLVIVPTDTPGLERSRLKKVGVHCSDTAELAFSDCRVPARYVLPPEGAGFRQIMQGFEGERLVLAVICNVQMRLMWEEARRYGHERKAFGHELLGFQSWRHRLADALTTIEASRALTYRAIEHYVRDGAANAEASMAKLFASEAVLKVGHECAQIFGGNRFMEEFLIARLLRDSLGFTVGAGTSEIMREIIARNMGLEPEGQSA